MLLHSIHHYACYCALLCLIQQQQQLLTAALTVIIDGANTNEWATRDEYQRLVEASGAPSAARAADLGEPEQRQSLSMSVGPPVALPAQSQAQSAPSAQFAQSEEGLGARELAAALKLGQRDGSAAQAIEFALDRLEMLEQQQRLQQQQQQQHRRRHKQAHQPPPPQGYPTPGSPSQQFAQESQLEQQLEQRQLQQQQQQQLLLQQQPQPQQQQQQQLPDSKPASSPLSEYLASRTLNDLVSARDSDFADVLRRRHLRDVDVPKRYCGADFYHVVDLVCGQRGYYDGQPIIVNPTVKSKRSTQYKTLGGSKPKASDECCDRPCDRAQLETYCNIK